MKTSDNSLKTCKNIKYKGNSPIKFRLSHIITDFSQISEFITHCLDFNENSHKDEISRIKLNNTEKSQ